MKRIAIFIVTLFLIGLISPLTYAVGEPFYKAFHPQGYVPPIKRIPLTPRIPDLNDKVVYIISSWPANVVSGFEEVLGAVKDSLKKKYPRANIIVKYKESAYMENEPQLWAEVKKKADAFLYLAADSAATSMWSVIWSTELEKKGTPGVDLIFDGFINNTQATCDKLGVRLRYVAVPLHGQNINATQMASIADQVMKGLTLPLNDQEKGTGVIIPVKPPRVALEGTLEEIQKYFYEKNWTDGLPIIPPTEENVAHMLKGTSHRADEIVTDKMMPEGWIATVEKVAVNGVMAGCRPEHMPVLLAAVEAFAKGDYDSSVRSTNSFSFMQLVNGPIAKTIGMNPDTYALGPGNLANATIGRALRLFIINLGGGAPGINIMGNQGNVSCYSFCFPENETASPWEPFHVSRGFKADESTVTIFAGGWSHTGNMLHQDIDRLARDIAYFQWPNGIVVLLSPLVAKDLAKKGPEQAAGAGSYLVPCDLDHGRIQKRPLLSAIHYSCPERS